MNSEETELAGNLNVVKLGLSEIEVPRRDAVV